MFFYLAEVVEVSMNQSNADDSKSLVYSIMMKSLKIKLK